MNIGQRYGNSTTWLIIALCFVSRIPMLTSPNMLLDGDESIVGLMSKHLYDGKAFPLYFYGQRYGFSLVEELFILPFYATMGMTGLAVKLAMLNLWTIGVVFLYKTFYRINTSYSWVPLVLTIIFILSPAWTEWSMKARGGYVSAFTLSSVTMYLLTDANIKSYKYYILIGLLIVLVYECMPLWLPLLLLLLVYKLKNDFNPRKLLLLIIAVALPEIALQVYKSGLYAVHETDKILPISDWLKNIPRVPEFLYISLHGYHYFFTVLQPNVSQIVFACGFIALIFFCIGCGIYMLMTQSGKNGYLTILMLSLIAALSVAVMNEYEHYRLLLPVPALTLLLLQVVVNYIKPRKWKMLLLVSVFVFSGIGSVIAFRNFKYTAVTADAARKTGEYLSQNGIKYVYSGHIYLGWQVMFYSQERVLCRDVSKLGRMPAYSMRIDEALKNGERTALIGMKDDYYGMNVTKPAFIDLIYVKPDMPLSELSKAFAIAP